jgi:hypothetical protein
MLSNVVEVSVTVPGREDVIGLSFCHGLIPRVGEMLHIFPHQKHYVRPAGYPSPIPADITKPLFLVVTQVEWWNPNGGPFLPEIHTRLATPEEVAMVPG